ncbi:microtubule-associated protein AIR9 [Sesamum angolense]|uniref:Microtubule-associated protein AIR9 n=1 Tax=Sesamum angolense TaxID=2727404 RepID=A0AAE2BVY2_9LAMI|nr:microtubule-associated protein AIR9 [Sesamum angolense]
MEVSMVQSSEDPVEMHRNTEPQQSDTRDSVTQLHALQLEEKPSVEGVKKAGKVLKPNATTTPRSTGTGGASKRKIEAKSGGDSSSNEARPTLTKPTMSSASRTSGSVPATRRSSTGGLPEKQPIMITKRQSTDVGLAAGKRTSSLASDPLRKSLPEIRRTSASSIAKPAIRQSVPETRKSVPISSVAKTLRTPTSSDSSKQDSSKKTSLRSSQLSVSSVKKISSPSLDSTGSSGSIRKSITKVNSLSARSPTVSSGSKSGSVSTSLDRSSTLPGRKKVGTPKSRDSRLIMLPQVEAKAGDDVIVTLGSGLNVARTKRAGMLWLSIICYYVKMQSVKGSSNFYFCSFFPLNEEIGSPGPQDTQSHHQWAELVTKSRVCLSQRQPPVHIGWFDLSFNDFKGPGFEPLENCKALQQLYLAGNQITSLKSLPELPNLEFLSVAQNKLKSLSMASQPRLQVLAASKNKISTLKGFPCLPALEHLRVEENPILKMSHLEAASILLVGPTLKKFNDRDLSREEIAIAKRYPSHTALCIRGGWELCRPEQAVDSTFKFLLEQWKEQLPSGYLLKHASVTNHLRKMLAVAALSLLDVTEDSGSALDLKYQWFIGDRTPSNFTAISGACKEIYFPKNDDIGRILKVECTPILGDTEYPTIFAISSPVSPGTGIPKVMKIDVRGSWWRETQLKGMLRLHGVEEPQRKVLLEICLSSSFERTIIPFHSWLRRRWNSSPVVIAGAEEEEYQLMLDDIDSCLVYMYTPVTEEGAKGEPQYVITDYVKAAPPSVTDVQVTGDTVEGNTIRGIGKYFGGKEGPSTFEWLREDKDTGEFTLVLTGTNEYTLTKEDVGRRLTFVYTPVNFEGQEGKSMSVVSPTVTQAPPRVTNIKIIGELKEGSKVTVTGIVTGGMEASSRVQWFKTSSSTFEGENGLEPLSTSKIAKAFRIPLGAVGKYIVAKFTPMTPDGEAGEPAYVISDTVVEISYGENAGSHVYANCDPNSSPSLNFLSVTGDYSEGGVLTASYGYIGGHEGKSIYNWYLHERNNSLEHVYACTNFTCLKNELTSPFGEPRTCIGQERVRPGNPRLLSLQINGTAIEGTTLNVEKKYWGGEEGESIYRWFRTSSNGTHSEISGATSSSYMLSVDDIGFFISVSCEPIRNDWAVVLLSFLNKLDQLCLSLEFHGSLVEGTHLSFIDSYSGGRPPLKGDCLYEWFRVKGNGLREKLHVGEFLDLTFNEVGECVELVYTPVRADGMKGSPKTLVSHPVAPGDPLGVELVIPDCSEGQEVVPEKRTYTPSVEDVGTYLALYWVPTRSDGKCGKPLVSICESPVIPAVPEVSNVCVKKLSSSTYYGEGEYFGGYEGASLFSWYRQSDDGTVLLIEGANSKTYEVTDEDYNCRLLFGYSPVRSDSVVGELRLSEPSDIILPELPRIEMLALTGKAVEGEVLTALEVIPKSENQQLVWGQYKKEVKYQWFFSSETENEKSFELFPSQRSCSYKVRFEDIGRYLRCECIVTDVFGRSSEPAYAETSSVLPGVPRMDKLEIEGRGFHTNLYAVRGVYSGGKEGKSRIQWLRSMVGSPDLISIPGETGRMYEANVDDVGYRLVAIYTPVRDDGVEGQPVSASTDPIAVEPDVHKEVKQKLDLGSVKFEALCDKDRSAKRVPGMGSLERRILEVNRKRVKVVKPGSKTSFPTTEIRGSYAPPFHDCVDSENEVDLMVQTRHLRDVIVLVIRGLAQRFNSTSLNTLLKIEA